MPDYVRVTDDVKPRREFSVLASSVTEAHTVLDKPGAFADGTPRPPKYTPHKTSAPSGAAKKSGSASADNGQSADTSKEN